MTWSIGGAPCRGLSIKRARKISQEIVAVLNPDGDANQRFGNAIFGPARLPEFEVDRLCYRDSQRPVVAQIGRRNDDSQP